MAAYLFAGGRFLDPRQSELRDGIEVLVEDDRVREVSERPIASPSATRVDLRGRTLMPGLIDAHVHFFLAEVNLGLLDGMPLTLLTTKAAAAARAMLMRGFTTVRDAGGTDFGLKAAIEEGLVKGPRVFIAGMPISQTGGHGDFRRRTQSGFECACCSGLAYMSRIADGVPEMLKAVRDERRKGADQIKLMVSGGVASQSDPLESLQFRVDEVAVLDAPHAQLDRAMDRVGAVGMGADILAPGIRLADGGADLLAGELRRLQRIAWASDAAGHHELDVVGTLAQLVAHRLQHLRHAVDDA